MQFQPNDPIWIQMKMFKKTIWSFMSCKYLPKAELCTGYYIFLSYTSSVGINNIVGSPWLLKTLWSFPQPLLCGGLSLKSSEIQFLWEPQTYLTIHPSKSIPIEGLLLIKLKFTPCWDWKSVVNMSLWPVLLLHTCLLVFEWAEVCAYYQLQCWSDMRTKIRVGEKFDQTSQTG